MVMQFDERDDALFEAIHTVPPDHKVHVVDDDDSFRISIVRLLQASGVAALGYRCAGEYLLGQHVDGPSCIVLDMCMPGPSGLDLLDSLASRSNSPPVILVTAFSDIPATVRALKAGAIDFLTKPIDGERLLHSVRVALAHDAKQRAARFDLQQLQQRFAGLTAYEREVFTGIVNGKLNKQLAATIGICERSIKTYRSRVMRKMCVSSLAALVKTAQLLGIAAPAAPRPEIRMRLQRPIYERPRAVNV